MSTEDEFSKVFEEGGVDEETPIAYQRLDENNQPMYDSEGNPMYEVDPVDKAKRLDLLNEEVEEDKADLEMYALAEMYQGDSEGFKELVRGYSSYAFEVLRNRAFPNAQDGLKPVQRRIAYSMASDRKYFSKENPSGDLIGRVMSLHPHGDSAIYDAACRMTDINKSFLIPLIKGGGNLGSVNTGKTQAAYRYTKMWLHPNLEDYTRDMDGCVFETAEMDENKQEPTYLPVRYPALLCNTAMGIGVGLSTNIPGYVFDDVVKLTIKYLKGEDVSREYLEPDFPTGGYILNDPREFLKITNVGKGRIRTRAKVEIDKTESTIRVLELPYGRTFRGLTEAIKKIANPGEDKGKIRPIPGLKDANNFSDRKSNDVTIECKRGTAKEVLLHLYKRNLLQSTFSVNMNTIVDREPLIGGVYDIIDAWYAGREVVLKKKFRAQLDGLKEEFENCNFFLKLVTNETTKEEYLRRITKVSIADANAYCHELFDSEGITGDTVDWISRRRASEFNKGGKYAQRLEDLQRTIDELNYNLTHIKEYVIEDLNDLLREHAGRHHRHSVLTNVQYKFVTHEEAKKDDNIEYSVEDSWFTFTAGGYAFKSRDLPRMGESMGEPLLQRVFKGDQTFIGFDNRGRVLRFYGDTVPVSKAGISLYDYFEVPSEWRVAYEGIPAYRILRMYPLDGSKYYLLHSDGKVSVFDTAKYMQSSVRHRINSSGVPDTVGTDLVAVYKENELPEAILTVDCGKTRETKRGEIVGYRLAWEYTSEIREPKSGSTKGNFLGGSDRLVFGYLGVTNEDLQQMLGDRKAFFEGNFRKADALENLAEIVEACEEPEYVELTR